MNEFNTCVILAAGRGSRMGTETPKVLLNVAGKPVLQYVVDFWTNQGIENFIFVVGYRKELILDYLEESRMKQYAIVCQEERKGIAHAIYQTRGLVKDKFVVALGDFIQIGEFETPDNLELGYSVWADARTKYLNQGCAVNINWKGFITGITEKADVKYPGMGTYFFDTRIFPYIEHSKPSSLRNEIEISDVMHSMIQDGQLIKAVPFYGDCINCTSPVDIAYAEKLLDKGVKIYR